jgi:peptide/nickel transport system substrate-binding protein
MIRGAAATLCLALFAAPAAAQNLRVGLNVDADLLDPTLGRTLVGRIVFAGLCDKLFDIDERLEIVPQLATGFRWDDPQTLTVTLRDGVRFHDGEAMTAESVAYSLTRHLTTQGSARRGEIGSMTTAEVVDPLTVRIRLKEPFAPFVSQLTDRAGMIISPRAAEASGRDFGTRPVCAGPMRFVERTAQSRIVLERFPEYWDAGRIHLSRVTYTIMPDNTARVANLRAGALDLIMGVEPGDLDQIRRDARLRVALSDSLGYWGITYNLGHGARAQTPFGQDRRVREAFELAIDRAAIVQVVYDGAFTPTAQAVPPGNPFHVPEVRPAPRDVARARALLAESGVRTPLAVDFLVPNTPDRRQVAEVIQAMVREAGFDLRITTMEFASSIQAAQRGDFELYYSGWSGRVDPDGNTWPFIHSRGPQNDGRYASAEADRLLDEARVQPDPAARRALYARLWDVVLQADRSRVYLWHDKNVAAHTARLSGFRAVPDGLIRLQDLRLQP